MERAEMISWYLKGQRCLLLRKRLPATDTPPTRLPKPPPTAAVPRVWVMDTGVYSPAKARRSQKYNRGASAEKSVSTYWNL